MGSNCRSGCRTKDCESYAACLRSANPQMNARTRNTIMNQTYDKTDMDLKAYRSARVNGIQPEGTTIEKVRAAEQASRALNRPYNAEKDPPTSMLVNKRTVEMTNRMANAND